MQDKEFTQDQIRTEIQEINKNQQRIKVGMVVFFIWTITTQSFISFDPNISVRLEFALQAFYYLLTLIAMIYFTRKLVLVIRSIFGNNNASFDSEILQVKRALVVFAFAYSLRVIRNTLVTIYWTPCFPVHRQLTTNLVNLIFYVLSDWIAIFFMLRVHSKNYSAKSQDKGEEDDEYTEEVVNDFYSQTRSQ